MSLKRLSSLMKSKNLSYNYEDKVTFQRVGSAALRKLAKRMGFIQSNVSFNAGGIAVSGDHSMYGMFEDGNGVVLYVSQGLFSNFAGYCRSIKHLKDYTGGANVWVSHEELADEDRLIAKLRSVANV